MVENYPIQINVINKLGQDTSKSSAIILPKICNVIDYVISYNICYAVYNH